jgi:hypothetical protein
MMILSEMKMRCGGSCGAVVVRSKYQEECTSDLTLVEFSAVHSDLIMKIWIKKRRIVYGLNLSQFQ